MRRITISLPDDVVAALEREARRRHLPVSQIARDAVAAHLRFIPEGERRVLPFAKLGSSGSPNIGRDMEELLAKEWVDPTGNR
jgi:hypothetical protein